MAIFKRLWQLKIPDKVVFLLWRVFLDRIPTKRNLNKRQVAIDDGDLSCIFYHEMEEDGSHLLFTCSVAYQMWMRMVQPDGDCFGSPFSPEEHFWQIGGLIKQWGSVVWSTIIWNLWTQRNAMVFEGQHLDSNQLWERILYMTWTWLKAYQKNFPWSYQQWQANPGLCLQ